MLLLALLGGGAGYGYGQGWFDKDDKSSKSGSADEDDKDGQTTEAQAATEAVDPAADGKIVITVSDGKISADGKECKDAAELKEYILSVNKDGTAYELVDDHAIKATYDEVKEVLSGLKYEFTEKKAE